MAFGMSVAFNVHCRQPRNLYFIVFVSVDKAD